MPVYTSNYNLYKPNLADTLEVATTLSTNFDTIDAEIKKREDEIDTVNIRVNGAEVEIGEVDQRISTIVAQAGTDNTEIVDARGGFTVLHDRLESMDKRTKNHRVDVMVDYGAVGDDVADDGVKIQQAITDVFNLGGGTVFIPKPPVKYKYSQTLLVPENVALEGIGEGTTASRLHYTGTDWAIVTSSKHQRNSFKGLRFDLNGASHGMRIGDIGANLAGNIPIQFYLENVTFENVATGYVALQTHNVSHISLKRVRMGFGSMVGGTALRISAGDYNSGVFKAEECTFGRVDATSTALEIDGAVNLDSYNFDSCYFGGENIKIGQNTIVRSVNFEGCHGEFRLLPGSLLPNVDAFQLYKVYGGSWRGGTITAFGVADSNAFRFMSDVKKFNIEGVEANGVMGAVYLQNGSTTVEGCILQEANLTNGATAVQYSGVSDQNFKLLAKRFQTENINVKSLFSVDALNKQEWASVIPSTGGWTRGDRLWNKVPSELGTAGSKYVVTGWLCTVTGTPGTWVEMRSLTGN